MKHMSLILLSVLSLTVSATSFANPTFGHNDAMVPIRHNDAKAPVRGHNDAKAPVRGHNDAKTGSENPLDSLGDSQGSQK